MITPRAIVWLKNRNNQHKNALCIIVKQPIGLAIQKHDNIIGQFAYMRKSVRMKRLN